MATSDAPLSIGAVTLRAKDRSTLASYYESVIGLNVITQDAESISMGVGDNVLLNLQEDRSAKIRPTEAGLYHTAFLLPERKHLGSWMRHAADSRVPIDGASDHGVSEAVYLQDPEGNGIEVYVDRDRTQWAYDSEKPKPTMSRLDAEGLMNLAYKPWQSAPDGTVVGHVHLQVGNIEDSNAFYIDEIGFSIVNEMSNASFYSTGGYHHHIAGNTWRSQNAGKRSPDSTGLVQFELLTTDVDGDMAGNTYTDPWGTLVQVNAIH